MAALWALWALRALLAVASAVLFFYAWRRCTRGRWVWRFRWFWAWF